MRLAMCNAASAAVDWLRPTPKPFGSARECAEAMVAAQHAPETHIIIVRGSDRGGVHARRPRKTKLPRVTHLDVYRNAGATKLAGVATLSSTLIRRELRMHGPAALGRLAASGAVPTTVAAMLEDEGQVT